MQRGVKLPRRKSGSAVHRFRHLPALQQVLCWGRTRRTLPDPLLPAISPPASCSAEEQAVLSFSALQRSVDRWTDCSAFRHSAPYFFILSSRTSCVNRRRARHRLAVHCLSRGNFANLRSHLPALGA